MPMEVDPILLGIITCLSTLFGGLFAARRREDIGILGALAAGILITTSLVDILPQTFTLSESTNIALEEIMALTVVGFLFLYIIFRIVNGRVFSKEADMLKLSIIWVEFSQYQNFRSTVSWMAWQLVSVLKSIFMLA
jgi:hypothetical protein